MLIEILNKTIEKRYITLAKETKLDDSADIYVKREKKTEKQKLSEMSFKEKVDYFKDYYLKACIIGICCVGVFGLFLYQTLSPRPKQILNIAVINDYYQESQDKLDTFLDNLDKHYNVNKEKQKITYDYSYFITGDGNGDSANSIQKLYTHVAAKELDVVIADEAIFKHQMQLGYFINLKNFLPDDLYEELSSLYMKDKLTAEYSNNNVADTTEQPYGIYLDSSEVFKSSGTILGKPVLGIITSTPNKENAIEFIRYLLDKENK